MRDPDPVDYAWWLSSRAAGVVAFALISLSVLLGLAMANRLVRGRTVVKLHEHLALAGLVAIAVHGITLLGDSWLEPGRDRAARPVRDGPRAGLHRPRRSSPATSPRCSGSRSTSAAASARSAGATLHRLTLLVYVLGVIHMLGAGSDASAPWLRAVLLATGAPILFLFLVRVLPEDAATRTRTRPEAS